MSADLAAIREALDGRTILLVPYCHADWAWTHSRRWHELRYVLALDEVLDIIAEQDEAGIGADAPEAFRWYTDCFRTQIAPFIHARPERIQELCRRISEGRIAICGGYANLRINHVPGELFIRGMVLGRREWQALVPDADLSVHSDIVDVAVGHPQTPQLLTLAGYRFLQFWRPEHALNEKGLPHQFVWEGLDGTRILAARGSYGGIARPEYAPDDFEERWDEVADFWWRDVLQYRLGHAAADVLWLNRGCDDARPLRTHVAHDEPMDLPGLIREWNERETSLMRFATPREAFALLEERADGLPVHSGTLDPCDVAYNAAWGGALGLWRLRAECADEIGRAEMLDALLGDPGGGRPRPHSAGEGTRATNGFFDDLWRDALLCSAHATQWLFQEDFDRLHTLAQSTVTRARESRLRSLEVLAQRVDAPERALSLLVNPLPRAREATVPVRLTFVRGDEGGAPEPMRLVDGEGRDVPWQLLTPLSHAGVTWELEALVRVDLPAGGWTSLRWEPEEPAEHPWPVPPEDVTSIATGDLALHFDRGRLMRIDDAVSGEEWSAPGDTPFGHLRIYDVDTTAPLHVGAILGRTDAVWGRWQVTEAGPLRWTMRCEGAVGACAATMDVRLYRGERRVEFAVEVDWDGRGGFLAAHLPCSGDGALSADMPFCVEDKPLADEPWAGIERTREGMFIARSFVDRVGDGRAIAWVSHDGDRWFIFDRERNELAHILINSVDEPYAQWEESVNRQMRGIGRHRFIFSIVPHEHNWRQAGLWQLSEHLRTPVLETLPTPGGDLPATGSLLEVAPAQVALSACYRDGERVIIRVFDTVGAGAQAQVTLPFGIAAAELVDLNGEPLDGAAPEVDERTLTLALTPWQIATVAVTPEPT